MGSDCESDWRKIIGKPYAGKLHVRFDEGELEIGPLATTPVLYSTGFFPLKKSMIIQHFIKEHCIRTTRIAWDFFAVSQSTQLS